MPINGREREHELRPEVEQELRRLGSSFVEHHLLRCTPNDAESAFPLQFV